MGTLKKYRSYVKELPLMPRLAVTALIGLVLVACAYLASLTAYYLLCRYVKASILTVTGLVNIYIAFPSPGKSQAKGPARKGASPASSMASTTAASKTAKPIAPLPARPTEAVASQLPPAGQDTAATPLLGAAEKPAVSPSGADTMTFAAVAKEFTEKLNGGSLDDDLPPGEFDDEGITDDM